MSNPNPFDFSDFGPSARPANPGNPPGVPGPPGGRPQGGAGSGFDPWANQPPSQPRAPQQDAFGGPAQQAGGFQTQQDVFGQSIGAAPGGAALQTAGPPLVWFAVALGLALLGVVLAAIGAVIGPMLSTAVAGWLLAGPVAIGALAAYTRVDTRRRTETIYSAPGWTATLYWVVLAVCLVGIGVGAWQIALWAGRQ